MTVTTNISNCARCGGNHVAMKFEPLKRAMVEHSLTHWAMCPITQEPVLLGILLSAGVQ